MSSRVMLVRAPNPSAMTLSGTNSYVIDCGNGRAICIDPGPAIERHVDALLDRAAAAACKIELIVLTHAHPDHAPAARLLQQRTGSTIAAHHRSEYPHDVGLRDGQIARAGEKQLQVMEAPGHAFDHLVFYEPQERALFTGDAVLGQGYVVIAPPGGAMRPYQRTLRRMLDEFSDAAVIYGGHGDPVHDPQAKLREYIAHREARQREILAALGLRAQTIPQLVRSIYRETDPVLWPAAARQLLAYLLALEQEGAVRSQPAQRALTAEERTLLNPQWERIVGPQHARMVEEELGTALRLDEVRVYRLAG